VIAFSRKRIAAFAAPARIAPKREGVSVAKNRCIECGEPLRARATVCPECGCDQVEGQDSQRLAAGLLAIFLGMFGVHKFVLGYTGEGTAMLVSSVVSLLVGVVGGACCFFPALLLLVPLIIGIIGFVEGVVYLSQSDADFIRTYQVGRRPWF
jgi:TM2 domain-containing membrane protein YozV